MGEKRRGGREKLLDIQNFVSGFSSLQCSQSMTHNKVLTIS